MMRYQKMTMKQLDELLVKKKKRIFALNSLAWRSYEQVDERNRLWKHINLIRAEIECRKRQMEIPF